MQDEFCPDVGRCFYLLAGVGAGLGLGQTHASTWEEAGGGNPRHQEVIDGDGSQQHSRYSGHSYHTPRVLEREAGGT